MVGWSKWNHLCKKAKGCAVIKFSWFSLLIIFSIVSCSKKPESIAHHVWKNGQVHGVVLRRLSQFLYLMPWETRDICINCKFLPLCLGGCAQQALLHKGSQGEVDCLKPYLQNYIPEAIKIKYDRSVLFPETIEDSKSRFTFKELLRL